MYCRSLPFYGWLLLSNRRNMCTCLTVNISKVVVSQWQRSRGFCWPSKALSNPSFWWGQGADSTSVNGRGWWEDLSALSVCFSASSCTLPSETGAALLSPRSALLVYTALTKFPRGCFPQRDGFHGNHYAPWDCCKRSRMSHCQNIYISGS